MSGPHPEADDSWYAEKGLSNPDGVRFDLAYELIEATAGRRRDRGVPHLERGHRREPMSTSGVVPVIDLTA